MRLHPPVFKLLPVTAAILSSYLVAGAIWVIPESIKALATTEHPFVDRLALALTLAFLSAVRTVISAGFPYGFGQAPTNTYPIIMPVMVVSLVLATGIIRPWPDSRKYFLRGLAIGGALLLAGCGSAVYLFGFVERCGPYACD
jgi:hypothetical protein